MAQDKSDQSRFGGEFMIQDRDHMSEIPQTPDKAERGAVRQSEQSQSPSRQQGGDQHADRQQGGGRYQSR